MRSAVSLYPGLGNSMVAASNMRVRAISTDEIADIPEEV
jgi:hypothetical protein